MTIRCLGLLGPVVFGIVVVSLPVFGQELSVSGNSSSASVLDVTNTSTSATNRAAVSGTSAPALGFGIGGTFSGGSIGAQGLAVGTSTTTQYGGYFRAQHGATNYGIYSFANGTGSYAGYFAGDVFVTGAITQSSDLRLKKDVRDMPAGALRSVLRLRPKTFYYDPSTEPSLGLHTEEQVGFVAQDVEKVFPSLVHRTTVPSGADEKPGTTVLSVDYIKVVPLLVKAMQEQADQITNLESEIGRLKQTSAGVGRRRGGARTRR